MIVPGTDARILIATHPVDFHKGPDSLAALVKAYGADPFSGVVHVFRAKRAGSSNGSEAAAKANLQRRR